ncbi:molybdopterin-dependent oxidoreductase [Thalassovita sp.]|jgi:DMSO/TMAO reductase YedYZ molybdopterin-dependent catalytic subunit|uniref:molybdopterin-dependent oxidoreductase n=1 Tax=Thalassovita sp. TaxID=1979401 RepID=UPI002AAFD7E0|nr:molybdopterin-dependent oxidoreductase [Thalassovita sp.]
MSSALPKGQFDIGKMPRFGLIQFADRFPSETGTPRLHISGDVENELVLDEELTGLQRTEIIADFHCVTTWSSLGLRWQGILFKHVFEQLIRPMAKPNENAAFVILKARDGARASLPLSDLLQDNVILADWLNDKPLTREHGAPLRLVAPDHYGYKNIKYINRIAFHVQNPGYRPSGLRFMEHPRARVAYEERGSTFPGWLLRYAYKPLVKPTIRIFANATKFKDQDNG